MRTSLVGCLLVVLGATLGACESGSPTAPVASSPPTSAPATTTAVPSTQVSADATPSATPRTKAQDTADLSKALVTPRDLGKPWVQPTSVSTAGGKKGELCPGHVSATKKLPARPAVVANFTEGKGDGKNIATFELSTLTGTESSELRTAYAKDAKACATYRDGSGLYVVRSVEGPTTVNGADEVVGRWAERIYYDKAHEKLAYARHYVVLRTGRVLTYVSYAFLTVTADPKAEDFSRTTKLASVQLKKSAAVFG